MGVATSVMVYQVCRRPAWRGWITAPKVLGTTVVLGLASWLAAESWSRFLDGSGSPTDQASVCFKLALVMAIALKLGFEAALLSPLRRSEHSPMRKSARLITGPLARVWALRCACSVAGASLGLILAILAQSMTPAIDAGFSTVLFVILLGGELLERGFFFASVVRLKMPRR